MLRNWQEWYFYGWTCGEPPRSVPSTRCIQRGSTIASKLAHQCVTESSISITRAYQTRPCCPPVHSVAVLANTVAVLRRHVVIMSWSPPNSCGTSIHRHGDESAPTSDFQMYKSSNGHTSLLESRRCSVWRWQQARLWRFQDYLRSPQCWLRADRTRDLIEKCYYLLSKKKRRHVLDTKSQSKNFRTVNNILIKYSKKTKMLSDH